MISVIIPVFNGEKFIGRCLRSLLNQTLSREKYEIIVINDASTDKTEYALKLFKEDIKVIKNKKNIGLPASLNKGINLSNSEFIVRVDSDDYVGVHFLQILSEFLLQNKYMHAVACDYVLIDEKEKVISRENCLSKPIGCGIMFRMQHLLDINLYNESFEFAEEEALRKEFLKKYSITRIPLSLYHYRIHEKNRSKNKRKVREFSKKLK